MHLVMEREVSGSNPGGVECFSTQLSFESNSSHISRLMFDFVVFENVCLQDIADCFSVVFAIFCFCHFMLLFKGELSFLMECGSNSSSDSKA